jgi:uncharacterized membrane protein
MNSIEPYQNQAVTSAASGELSPARCKNCEAALLGRYCANCSQAADVHVPTTMELAHELLEGLTHSDSRLWRTLTTLWFKPGKLTEEFVAGRRVSYLPPFRLYLVLSVVFFLLASVVHINVVALKFDEATKPGGAPTVSSGSPDATQTTFNSCDDVAFITFDKHPNWKPRLKRACEAMAGDNGNSVLHAAIGPASKAMFILLPLIAFFNMLMYWRPRYRYAEQLLFFVHLQAFYFCAATLLVLLIEAGYSWPRIDGVTGILEALLWWCLPVYTLLAMRRVFRRSWLSTIFKAVVLLLVYLVVFVLAMFSAVVYAAFQL